LLLLNPDSFNKNGIVETVITGKEKNHEITLLICDELNFNPILSSADLLTFAFKTVPADIQTRHNFYFVGR
jgi:hypothetical protein